MITFFITILFILVVFPILRAIYLDDKTDLKIIYLFGIFIVIVTYVAALVATNREYTIETSKTLVIPSTEVRTTVKNNKVIDSDTTYTYKFKNE